MSQLVKVRLHGILGKRLRKKEWELDVSSVSEAIYAINVNTNFKLRKVLLDHKNHNVKYGVLVNRNLIENNKQIKNNSLFLRYSNLETIDIVPVVEGAFFGFLSLAFGVGLLSFAGNAMVANIAAVLIFAGISELLSKPPEMPEARQITNPSSDPVALGESYLFNGPVNVINEGGPVPIGYGRLIVGSQVILSSYEVTAVFTDKAGRVI